MEVMSFVFLNKLKVRSRSLNISATILFIYSCIHKTLMYSNSIHDKINISAIEVILHKRFVNE